MALCFRFEPPSQRTWYQAELQTRRKKRDETWADYADCLRLICDKAYPDLDDGARETLALQAYLSRLMDPQVAFGVKQRTPRDLNEVITVTIELEPYLPASVTSVSSVEEQETGPKNETATDGGVVAAVCYREASNHGGYLDQAHREIGGITVPSREDQHAARRSDETTRPDEK